jgi:dihydrofolate reductase
MEPHNHKRKLTNSNINLIACIDSDFGIGLDNKLIYDIPEDKSIFKTLTFGQTVIMGRKTWESLPEKFRPLPLRTNFVISRDPTFKAPGAIVFSSIEDALQCCVTNDAFIIGGQEIYEIGMTYADRIVLSVVRGETRAADRFFPKIPIADFRENLIETIDSKCGLTFSVFHYLRIKKETS